VVPWSCGGRTNLDNLVTFCWSCNNGKNECTVEELRSEDPRVSPPSVYRFDGRRSPLVN